MTLSTLEAGRTSAGRPAEQVLLFPSNVGMTVLCHAFERVAGEPFNALLKRRLLNPLSVCTTSFSRALPSAR